ncbi:hypothetical protein [Rhizobium sp. SL86]|uniref:hypothetical protein n=1 Tax=Rhizobium sp. SL86 TaxID=2995148 RepID=UPI00227367D7|nr:hypothetical protein [Rhizobium sp. SL86]MCY1664594.1 hypothetical protein [Rhizobium sp. SL86]
MQRMKKNKKSMQEANVMAQSVRIDRDAFRRGVNDVMTFAPLRDAVRNATDLFGGMRHQNTERAERDDTKTGKNVKEHDGKSTFRK